MLLRMYLRWAERHRFKTEIVDSAGGRAGRDQERDRRGRRAIGVRLAPRRARRPPPRPDQPVRRPEAAPDDVRPRRGPARGRRRHRDRAELGRDPGRHVPVPGRRRPAREQDRLGRPADPPQDRDRRPEPERAEPDPEQGDGDPRPEGAPPRASPRGAGGRGPEAEGRARRGRLGQPDPELRPPSLPDGQGPPDQPRDRQHPGGPRRRPRRRSCRPSSSGWRPAGRRRAARPRPWTTSEWRPGDRCVLDRARRRPDPGSASSSDRSAPTSSRPARGSGATRSTTTSAGSASPRSPTTSPRSSASTPTSGRPIPRRFLVAERDGRVRRRSSSPSRRGESVVPLDAVRPARGPGPRAGPAAPRRGLAGGWLDAAPGRPRRTAPSRSRTGCTARSGSCRGSRSCASSAWPIDRPSCRRFPTGSRRSGSTRWTATWTACRGPRSSPSWRTSTGTRPGSTAPWTGRSSRSRPGPASCSATATAASSATATPRSRAGSARSPFATRRSWPRSIGHLRPDRPPARRVRHVGRRALPATRSSPLLRAGFRIDGFPVLLCWDRPFADFARYLPISPGLL